MGESLIPMLIPTTTHHFAVPLEVKLLDIHPQLFGSLLPYTSRLAHLAARVSDSSDFGLIVQQPRGWSRSRDHRDLHP